MIQAANIAIYVLTLAVFISLGLRLAGRLPPERVGTVWGWTALVVLGVGLYLGLVRAPSDFQMGEVQRIMYVHAPSWMGAAAGFTTAFLASLVYLKKRDPRLDYWAHAGVEVGLVFNAVGLITGSIWGRPTWGVWWTWDPRMTATAVMFISFAGYLNLRAWIEEPEKRARTAAVAAIVAYMSVPVAYVSVNWWRTLHPLRSTPDTVDLEMVLPLRTMMLAFLLVFSWMLTHRYELARLQGEDERGYLKLELAS